MDFNTIYGTAPSYFGSQLLSYDKKPGDQIADDDGFVRGVDFTAA